MGAFLLFTTRPTDRALTGWLPYEAKMLGEMSEAQAEEWARDDGWPFLWNG